MGNLFLVTTLPINETITFFKKISDFLENFSPKLGEKIVLYLNLNP